MGENKPVAKTVIKLHQELLKYLLARLDRDNGEHLRGVIMLRGKDTNTTGARVLKRYTFSRVEDYYSYEKEIENFVEQGARFYINPTPKSYEQIALDFSVEVAKRIRGREYNTLKNLYDSVADANTGVKDKRIWIIDIDYNPPVQSTSKVILDLVAMGKYGGLVKTPNGVHILLTPLDPRLIKELLDNVGIGLKDYEILKNSMTPIGYKPN